MNNKFETIAGKRIFFDETYYIAYAGGRRELSQKDEKEYRKILHLPFILQRKELRKIGFDKNPNVIPIKGVNLLTFIRELKFVPFFDQYFDQSHMLQLNDAVVYEAIRQKNYELAMRG